MARMPSCSQMRVLAAPLLPGPAPLMNDDIASPMGQCWTLSEAVLMTTIRTRWNLCAQKELVERGRMCRVCAYPTQKGTLGTGGG